MPQRSRTIVAVAAVALVRIAAVAAARAAAPPATLALDATGAPRRILHARLVLPAAPGPLTLEYPKWVRGEHGPNGPIADLAGLRFSAGGRTLAWRRDDVDMYAFHLDVPAGASAVEAELDFLMPVRAGNYSSGVSSSASLAIVNWFQVVLYPKGTPSDDVTVAARVRLPAGWRFATALPVARESGSEVEFEPTSLTTLADSPLVCGAHVRSVPVGEVAGAPHELDVTADSEAALDVPPGTVAGLRRMVAEFHALFGGHHYRSYRWLLTLSDKVHRAGIEHHESSDDRYPERAFSDPGLLTLLPELLAHEYVHSWNGKYRRPAGLSGADFETPMRGDLLWVYEGLTTYLGNLMPVRSGFVTPEQYREQLADAAAAMSDQAGRAWRSIEDTAVAAQTLFGSAEEWRSWRRGADFYPESALIWLEADAVIRERTGGKRSLDDFCRAFFGGPSTPAMLRTYTLEDLLAALGEVAPYDWKGFFERRIYSVAPGPPLGGIERSGWKLVFTPTPNAWSRLQEAAWKYVNLMDTVGLRLKPDGTVVDAIPGAPAALAGIAPGMVVRAVNGRAFELDRLREAIATSAAPGSALDLLVDNDGEISTCRVEYHGGERGAHLERDPSRPDLLGEIAAPRAAGR